MAVALSRAWLCPYVKGDLVQGDDLSAGTGIPWGDHGTCRKKTRMGDDVLVLRMRVPEWGVEDAWRKARGRNGTECSCPGSFPRAQGSVVGGLLDLGIVCGIEMPTESFEVMTISHQRQSPVLART